MRRKLWGPLTGLWDAVRWRLTGWRYARTCRKTGHRIERYIDRLVSDTILFNEIPSPTEGERQRTDFILRRLSDLGITGTDVDQAGNVTVLLPASEPTEDSILFFANIENDAYSPQESLVKLTKERASGRGIAENSLGVAALLVLAEYLLANEVRFGRNIILLFTILRSTGGAFAALEHFLERWTGNLAAAFYVSGTTLGALPADPVGTCRFTVKVRTREKNQLTVAGARNAVSVLADIAFRLGSIRWDERSSTFVNVARVAAGTGYGHFAAEGIMELEIISRDTRLLEISRETVRATIRKVADETGAAVQVGTHSFIPVGDVEVSRPACEALRRVHGRLGIRSRRLSRPDISAVLSARGVPALSVGLTSGRKTFDEEYVDLPPLAAGFQQLLLLPDAVASP
jgi:tripeptide aminopeptidase